MGQLNRSTTKQYQFLSQVTLCFFKLISLELHMLGYMSGMENLLMQMAVMERPILQLKSGKAYIPS
jgi:hypothetical protein